MTLTEREKNIILEALAKLILETDDKVDLALYNKIKSEPASDEQRI